MSGRRPPPITPLAMGMSAWFSLSLVIDAAKVGFEFFEKWEEDTVEAGEHYIRAHNNNPTERCIIQTFPFGVVEQAWCFWP